MINLYQPFKAYWLRDAPTGLTFNNCKLCPRCNYVFCIYLRTNSDLCHLQHKLIVWFLPYRSVAITNSYYDRQSQQCFFINLLFYKLQDVLILTTCFGHLDVLDSSCRPEDGHTMTETCSQY